MPTSAKLTAPQDIKVFILCMMKQVGYPLFYSNVADIVMQDGFVHFTDFGTYLSKLIDDGHVLELEHEPGKDPENMRGHRTYELTDKGRFVAEGLESTIPLYIREKAYRSAIRYLNFEKNGATLSQNYFADGDGYLFHCDISEGGKTHLDLTVRADNEYQLKQMKTTYATKPEVVFKGIKALLTGEVDYLFGDKK